LDDVKAEVRLQALQVLKAALPPEVPNEYSSHMELLFKTILIHLDDQDKNYSSAVLGIFYYSKCIGASSTSFFINYRNSEANWAGGCPSGNQTSRSLQKPFHKSGCM
jgi:hypothetical protein